MQRWQAGVVVAPSLGEVEEQGEWEAECKRTEMDHSAAEHFWGWERRT